MRVFYVEKNNDNSYLISVLGYKLKFGLKKFRRHENLMEKNIILNSGFWDPLWYVQKYHKNFNRIEAFEYWYNVGWKKGESPCKYINTEFCPKQVNPVIAYLSKQFCFSPDNQNNYKQENDNLRIQEYLNYKKSRKAKLVVYTCITNDYDDLKEIEIYKYLNNNWDYVCFSDNENLIKQGQLGIWEVRPLQFAELDNTRNNRWHKLLPHRIFPEYEESIYIDANINILSSFLCDEIEKRHESFILPKHFKNLCIYSEYNDVKKAGLDEDKIIDSELEVIKQSGMPENFGFAENNILYRKHHEAQIVKIDEEWWSMVENYAKRDQLSLVYILWKNNINVNKITFENSRLLINDFYVFGHKKGRK